MPPKKIQKLSQPPVAAVENSSGEDDVDDDTTNILESISDQMLQQKVNDIIRYMLNMQRKKLPFKKSDIAKDVMQNYKAEFPYCFNVACERLKNVFGFKVVEMMYKRGQFLIVNCLEKSICPSASKGDDEEAAKYGLLTSLLSYLFMRNPEHPSSNEKEVSKFLNKLDVDLTDKNHSTFGDVKNLLTREFVQQQYVQIRKVQNVDGSSDFEYSWGERAELEFSKRKCLEVYCAIYNNVQVPHDWAIHYAEVLKEEEENAEENA